MKRPPSPRLRPIAARDLALLVRHRRRMWEEMGYRKAEELEAADRVYAAWVRRQRKLRRLAGYVAVDGAGRALASGCVWLYEVHPRPGRPGPFEPYVLSMYTEPVARGRGLATAIVGALLRWSRARGFGAAFLHAADAARPLYARLGFTATREMRLRFRRAPRPPRPRGSPSSRRGAPRG